MELTSSLVGGFVKHYLHSRFDEPVATPKFHYDLWRTCSDWDVRRAVIAAPRGHAKSTAITHAWLLACLMFRAKSYILIVSDTADQAALFLGTIAEELKTNVPMREDFGISHFVKEAVTDIIVKFKDGTLFRIQSLGASQKVRGRKWGAKRPDLIVCDDLENDEMVESDDQREKVRNWFLKALVPSLAKSGHIRVVGTILHLDSLLYRLLHNSAWDGHCYRAHRSFDDFSELLWPEQWPEERLRRERQQYIEDGKPEGYSTEYLNDPMDQSEAYFRKDDFREMEDSDFNKPMSFYAGVDLAISDKDRAAYTAIVVGGLDAEGVLYIRDVMRFRGDSDEIIRNMFALQQKWGILLWKIEEGHIEKSLRGEMHRRMLDSGIYLNLNPETPVRDKRSRARSIQGRMRAGGVRFDKRTGWFEELQIEMLQFPKGAYKDQVDAIAWLGLAIAELVEGPTKEEREKEEKEAKDKQEFPEESLFLIGRNATTGY